ncbi:hypothetical protein BMT55_00240 [Listeria newyorkensis]|uniref:Cadherin-like beta sandwich domain-containing protein n=1 Tax=Listeria newyorkensis TaxID=1497681 RepID=A0A841YXR0_9LIST|nr:hypothetical protein [Listeria newyorkensis]KGL44058.1 hypothetical protein EP58_06275 [Listeria newyorkensis]KMT61520.1 hypothetical protein X559_2183 [Listeria newyorkensis]MBC1458115.1 hypothetical protein [Listeria newyorkensis]PNP94813.1 hypothetical protein BMT55_00240 [Listeria newyorkensis]WAO21766.1 hypothetical protein OTR81_00230 [Listeria newyorkensis]
MKKRFYGFLLFILFFSTSIHMPVNAATTSPTTSDDSANDFMEMFEIDTYTAANPYILVSGNTATIMFTTDEDAKVSIRSGSIYVKTTDYTRDQELSINQLQETNQLILTVTTKAGVSTSYPITIKTTPEPKHKVVPRITETSLSSSRRTHS